MEILSKHVRIVLSGVAVCAGLVTPVRADAAWSFGGWSHIVTSPGALLSGSGVMSTGASSAEVVRADTLDLVDLRDAAARTDPRSIEPRLLRRAAELRVDALRALRRPMISATATATIQNETPDLPIDIPGSTLEIPTTPRDQYRTTLQTEWTIYDGGRVRRGRAVQEARLSEGLAGVDVSLYSVREATSDSYFGALMAEAQAEVLELTVNDLQARLDIMRTRAAEGAVLRAAADALEAELIGVQQELERVRVQRRSALDILSRLTELEIDTTDVLSIPEFSDRITQVRPVLDPSFRPDSGAVGSATDRIGHPRITVLAEQARASELEAAARRTELHPTVSLFGQTGVARPSPFDFLSDDFSGYGMAGIRLRWSIFDWGRTRREASALELQARIAEAEADAFAASLIRAGQSHLAEWDRLGRTLEQDRRVITLREEAARVAALQLDEGIILADIYVDRLTDLSTARITLDRHRLERSLTGARLLSMLGRLPDSLLSGTDTSYNLSSDR